MKTNIGFKIFETVVRSWCGGIYYLWKIKRRKKIEREVEKNNHEKLSVSVRNFRVQFKKWLRETQL